MRRLARGAVRAECACITSCHTYEHSSSVAHSNKRRCISVAHADERALAVRNDDGATLTVT
jgi:hypothetical protein